MELVQKLMKKTSKYLFYSPLTEKVLTECPCTMLLVTVHQVVSKVYFQEIFQDGDAWETRWVQSSVEFEGAEKHYGNFTLHDGGKYAGDKAIKTNQSTLFYAISSKFHETMTNK